MADQQHHQEFQDRFGNKDLIENDDQGLETASTITTTHTRLSDHPELDEGDSGDYFSGAIEIANSRDHHTGPFDDPLSDASNDELESSNTLHIEYNEDDEGSSLLHDINTASNRGGGGNGGGGSNSLGLQGVTKDSHAAQLSHRHDLHERITTHADGHGFVGGLIWALVVVHVLLLLILIAAWWRQRRSKDPTMRSLTPGPPQKVGCSYDMDKSFSIPKIELGNLPIKALKTLKQVKA